MRSALVGVVLIGCSAKMQAPATPDADAVLGDSAVDAAIAADAPVDAPDPTAGVDWFTWPEQQPGLSDATLGRAADGHRAPPARRSTGISTGSPTTG